MPRWSLVHWRRKAKLCIACGERPPERKRVRCAVCLEIAADEARARRDAQKAAASG